MVIRFSEKLPDIKGRTESDKIAFNEIGFSATFVRQVPLSRIVCNDNDKINVNYELNHRCDQLRTRNVKKNPF